eukprot:Skav201374  [mRNA]  locus=scaffold176:490609:494030:- [translate_table: standard]
MNDVQTKLAAFVASLSVLEAEKTLYEANAKKAAAPWSRISDQESDDLKAAIEARATDVMHQAGRGCNELKSTLSQSLGALDTLVPWRTLRQRVPPGYLHTDLQSLHRCCCCGYSPLIALGSPSVPSATIDGIRAARFASDETGITRTAERRLRVPQRRLQRRLATTPYSVCGEAHKTAKPHVDTALNEATCGSPADLWEA